MTELQVYALQQITITMAAIEQDHALIKSGQIILEDDDHYDTAKVEASINAIKTELAALCDNGGRTDT